MNTEPVTSPDKVLRTLPIEPDTTPQPLSSQSLVDRISALSPAQQHFLSELPRHRHLSPGALGSRLGLSPSTVRRWRRQEPFKSTYTSLLESQSSFPLIAIERAKVSSWNLTEKLISLGLQTDINLPANKLGHSLAATDRVLRLAGLLKESPVVALTFEAAILGAHSTPNPSPSPYWQS